TIFEVRKVESKFKGQQNTMYVFGDTVFSARSKGSSMGSFFAADEPLSLDLDRFLANKSQRSISTSLFPSPNGNNAAASHTSGNPGAMCRERFIAAHSESSSSFFKLSTRLESSNSSSPASTSTGMVA